MFGKLLKYDFRSMLKQFAVVWPVALALALVNRFLMAMNIEEATKLGATVNVVSLLVYVAILAAMFVLAMIFVIQRFYKGLLGDEGYLMHTLPVKPWQLIGSKLLCAVVVTVVSILVAIASIFLLIPWESGDWRPFLEALNELVSWENVSGFLELLLLILVGIAQSYLLLYLAMAVGHLFHKHRVALSFVAYIAISSLQRFLVAMFGFDFLDRMFLSDSQSLYFWLLIASEALLAAIYFVITNYILKNKLNLE